MVQAEFTSYRGSDAAKQVQHGNDGEQEAAAEAEDEHLSGRFLKLRRTKVLSSGAETQSRCPGCSEEERQEDAESFALRYENRGTAPSCLSPS